MAEKIAITVTYYTEAVLPKGDQEIENQRPSTGTQNVLIQHDSGIPHKRSARRLRGWCRPYQ